MALKPHPKSRFARLIPQGGSVLDVGCWAYSYFKYCQGIGCTHLQHSGIDREIPDEAIPEGYRFIPVDVMVEKFPFPDGSFDAVVASHVIEHLTDPLHMMGEIFRVLKRDGLVYLECPSDRSQRLPSMPFRWHEFRSLNFYDDPTHIGRPHTPQSLYRLFCMFHAEVVESAYLISNAVRLRLPYLLLRSWLQRDAALLEFALWWSVGFCVYGIARKTDAAAPRYVVSG